MVYLELHKKRKRIFNAFRFLAPCYEAAGKEPKKPRYGGWESKQISGHSLGHFLSALMK